MNANIVEPQMVSVIVPTKDCADSLLRCLESVRAQDHRLFEIIVVDNASTDNTAAVAKSLADLAANGGPERSAQRNLGAAMSRGEYLVFLDSDMICEPSLLTDISDTFTDRPDLDALVIPELVSGRGFWFRCRSLEKQLYLGTPIEAARAFRRVAFEKASGYDETIHGGGEDWDLPERLQDSGCSIGRTVAGVIHEEGKISLRTDFKKKLYYGRTIRRYARGHPKAFSKKLVRTPLLKALLAFPRKPATVLGLYIMKATELAGLMAGILLSFVRHHPADA